MRRSRLLAVSVPPRGFLGRWLSAALFTGTLVAGCRGADDRPVGVIRRDSAGARIVENGPSRNAEADAWTLSPRPLLDIGMVEGPEQYRLFRVTDAKLLPDTGVLVVNAGSQEIRRFDAAGTFLYAFGHTGEGPGEFRFPALIVPYRGDTVAVWDDRLRRIALFTLSGDFLRQILLDRPAANPNLVTAFPDGSFLVGDARFDLPASGFRDMQFTLVRYSSAGMFLDSAGAYFLGQFGTLGDVGMVGAPVFAPQGTVAPSADGFWIGSGQAYDVRRYDPTGALLEIVRWSGPSRTIDREDVEAHWIRRLEGRTGNDRRRIERMREVTPVADAFPAYAALRVAADGHLWIQPYRRPRDSEADTWWVLDADGEVMATATVPSTLHITDIGERLVLGIERDSLDVEHVRLYRLLGP